MRGAPSIVASPFRIIGIIPAYAGSTDSGNLWQVLAQDHPRVCGEHVALAP